MHGHGFPGVALVAIGLALAAPTPSEAGRVTKHGLRGVPKRVKQKLTPGAKVLVIRRGLETAPTAILDRRGVWLLKPGRPKGKDDGWVHVPTRDHVAPTLRQKVQHGDRKILVEGAFYELESGVDYFDQDQWTGHGELDDGNSLATTRMTVGRARFTLDGQHGGEDAMVARVLTSARAREQGKRGRSRHRSHGGTQQTYRSKMARLLQARGGPRFNRQRLPWAELGQAVEFGLDPESFEALPLSESLGLLTGDGREYVTWRAKGHEDVPAGAEEAFAQALVEDATRGSALELELGVFVNDGVASIDGYSAETVDIGDR